MKILITGGAGFIGSHIADIFLENDWEVVVIDNFSTGKKENLNSRVKIYKADICDKEQIEKIFESEKPDVVSHPRVKIVSGADEYICQSLLHWCVYATNLKI